MVLAGSCDLKRWVASFMNRLTILSENLALAEVAEAGMLNFPSFWGSVSVNPSPNPSPLKRTANRCSLPGLMVTFTPSISPMPFCKSLQRSLFFSVEILPALLSMMTPFSSMVAKFPLAAISPSVRCIPIPKASNTPRPIWYLMGSYPKRAR